MPTTTSVPRPARRRPSESIATVLPTPGAAPRYTLSRPLGTLGSSNDTRSCPMTPTARRRLPDPPGSCTVGEASYPGAVRRRDAGARVRVLPPRTDSPTLARHSDQPLWGRDNPRSRCSVTSEVAATGGGRLGGRPGPGSVREITGAVAEPSSA